MCHQNGARKRWEIAKDYAVLDVYRRYKQFKPQGISALNEGGMQLAQALANEIVEVVDQIITGKGGDENG